MKFQSREIRQSLEQRLYQLIISRLDGEKISLTSYQQQIVRLIEKGIGGFILFGGEKAEMKGFIRTIQQLSEIPLFIASDIERGVGQQIKGCAQFPCQMAVASAVERNNLVDVSMLAEALKEIAFEAGDIGINMPLIPVLDVNRNPDNPIICTRAFSDDPAQVAWLGEVYIRTLEEAGLLSCAKHFPGHGDTALDSHIQLPVISKSYKDLLDTDIVPFRHAVNAGVSGIMAGHLSIPAIDNQPASLSEKVIKNLLRTECGFRGLVLTDALNMHALKGTGKVSEKCMKAGVDVLLHPDDADVTVQELMHAIEAGEISEELIDSAVTRILHAKEKLTGRKEDFYYDNRRLQELSSQISDKSVTLVRNKSGLLPVSDLKNIPVVLAGDEHYFADSSLRRFFHNVSLLEDTPPIGSNPVIFSIFTSISAWKGSSGIDQSAKDRICEICKTAGHSIVISFGSPYILRHFKDADMLIAAYEATIQAEEAVIKCLEGLQDFRGRLPVKIDL